MSDNVERFARRVDSDIAASKNHGYYETEIANCDARAMLRVIRAAAAVDYHAADAHGLLDRNLDEAMQEMNLALANLPGGSDDE